MDLGLKDKIALVAASSTGLGFAAALELAREGAKVAICSRSQEKLDEAVARLRAALGEDTAVAAYTVELTDPDQIKALVDDVVTHFGGLDILITNAGGPPGGTFDTTALEAWDIGYDLTLMSATRLIHAALPHLRQSSAASILTVTSISVKEPIDGLLLSNVFRPAVVGLTKTLSQELGPENIRVNSILPGWTATERVNYLFEYRARQNNTSAEVERARITASIPLGHMADPAEFGRAATFLVSPAASAINGAMIQVDGGSYSGLL